MVTHHIDRRQEPLLKFFNFQLLTSKVGVSVPTSESRIVGTNATTTRGEINFYFYPVFFNVPVPIVHLTGPRLTGVLLSANHDRPLFRTTFDSMSPKPIFM